MRNKIFVLLLYIVGPVILGRSQDKDLEVSYTMFKQSLSKDYIEFRDECNRKYADFLRTSWAWFQCKAPLHLPDDKRPVPPLPYNPIEHKPVSVNPNPITPVELNPQPKPITPFEEHPNPLDVAFPLNFYGITCVIRLPEPTKQATTIKDANPNSIVEGWERLAKDGLNNTIRDCLEARARYNLCDWAYLMFLDKLGKTYCSDSNGATLLTAFLYCQSGYQMRLAVDGNRLLLLYGSRHQIFDKGYFDIDGTRFYPMDELSNSVKICKAVFEGETPMSLIIAREQMLGPRISPVRNITSARNDIDVMSQVPEDLIEFYNNYPASTVDGNALTRWAMVANTPLSQTTKDILYSSLKKSVNGCSKPEAVNKLLNWVQTGFEYEYDDKVWGHDRAFFAEETLYYPYCDCEDRSILFSRLVRDLAGLDVALIYYPGHLATAVKFYTDVEGDAMIINGDRYIVCDPTYIGAPVGKQMPGLEYDKAQAIILQR